MMAQFRGSEFWKFKPQRTQRYAECLLVPTLCVVTHIARCLKQDSCCLTRVEASMHSHAERGNEIHIFFSLRTSASSAV